MTATGVKTIRTGERLNSALNTGRARWGFGANGQVKEWMEMTKRNLVRYQGWKKRSLVRCQSGGFLTNWLNRTLC